MNDDLTSQNVNGATGGGLLNQPSKSPLEQNLENNSTTPQDMTSASPVGLPPIDAPPTPPTLLVSTPSPAPAGDTAGADQPVKAPDTDEFIQSILSNSTPPSTTDKASSPPAEQPMQIQNEEPAGSVNIAGGDGIKGDISPQATEATPPKVGPSPMMDFGPKDGQPVANDVVAAMQSKGPAKASSGKTVILIVLLLALAAGGYLAYSKLTTSSSSSATETSLTGLDSTGTGIEPATPLAATATTALTGDAKRKADLFTIQGLLKDYLAQEGTYPVSESIVMLNTAGNILEIELLAKTGVSVPSDPDTARAYGYKSDGKTFTLSAVLDDKTDSEGSLEGGLFLFKVTPDTIQQAVASTPDTSAAATDSFSASSTSGGLTANPTDDASAAGIMTDTTLSTDPSADALTGGQI